MNSDNPLAQIWQSVPNAQCGSLQPINNKINLSSNQSNSASSGFETGSSPRSSISCGSSSSSPLSLGLSVPLPSPSPLSSQHQPGSPPIHNSPPLQLSPHSNFSALYPDDSKGHFSAFSSSSTITPRPSGPAEAEFGGVTQKQGQPSQGTRPQMTTTNLGPSVRSPTSPAPAPENTQAALAEIFAGNPRPHYRSPAFGPGAGLPSGPGPLSPRADPAGEPQTRSYFSPPPPGTHRGRSLSSAPTFEMRGPLNPPSYHPIGAGAGWAGSTTAAAGPSQADQHGYRPSSSLNNGGNLSASLPMQIGGGPRSESIGAGSGRGESSSPASRAFGPASLSSNIGFDQASGWRPSGGMKPASLGWGNDEAERERGRARASLGGDGWGSLPSAAQFHQPSGIASSNTSPFTRADLRLQPSHSPSGGSSSDFLGFGSQPTRGTRDYSLGAVGSGRKRGESVWGMSRMDEKDEEDDDAVPPTRSGATSRRHSFAAFEGGRREVGFHLPPEIAAGSSALNSSGGSSLWGNALGVSTGLGSSAIQDDDLAADLNSLHLNLEAHVAQTTAATTSQPFAPSTSSLFSPPPSATFSSSTSGTPFTRFDQDSARAYAPPFGLPPPNSANNFYSAPSNHLGLSAHAPSFKAFTPATTAHPFVSQVSAYSQSPPTQPSYASAYSPMTVPPSERPSTWAQPTPDLSTLGRGVPLHTVPADKPLYIVEFKAGRKDLFFVDDPNLQLRQGDLVIVEADRGKDIGKFYRSCSLDEVQQFQQRLVEMALGQLAHPQSGGVTAGGGPPNAAALARMTKEFQPKKIFGKAGPSDTHMLLAKAQDEVKALALVRNKVAQKGLAMEVCDAEWQWDRRKLTFYYVADSRVDFRELVRELFRLYKTRIWLCCLDVQAPAWNFA